MLFNLFHLVVVVDVHIFKHYNFIYPPMGSVLYFNVDLQYCSLIVLMKDMKINIGT